MFIVWGSRTIPKILGKRSDYLRCSRCKNVSHYSVIRFRKWFTLFWVPIFPFYSSYFFQCPVCSYGYRIKKQEAYNLIAQEKEKIIDNSNIIDQDDNVAVSE